MIQAVKDNIDIPLIVGGGIRTVKTARQKTEAGADIIVTGTAIEQEDDVEQALKLIVKELKY
jgi:phosphoglycerol geranylgeranyltransferase